jgi:hypothetical protein
MISTPMRVTDDFCSIDIRSWGTTWSVELWSLIDRRHPFASTLSFSFLFFPLDLQVIFIKVIELRFLLFGCRQVNLHRFQFPTITSALPAGIPAIAER